MFDDHFFGPNPSRSEMTAPAGRARDALRGCRFPVELVPMRLGHYERGESPLAEEVRRDGITLYDQGGKGAAGG